jgi:hypothetical protein
MVADKTLVPRLRDDVRDAVAVLRLYQRECIPGFSVDRQTFGLDGDIRSTATGYWASDRTGYRGSGSERHGVLSHWEFSRQQIRTFRDRPAFALLDDGLRGEPAGPLVDRAIVALRALNYATAMLREPMRIVLQATALEALLGDDASQGGDFRPQAHPVARRAAFLTCPADGQRMAAGDSPCICLTASTPSQLAKDPTMARRPTDRWDWPCTSYWRFREVFAARNKALHEAADDFPRLTAERFEGRVDDLMLAALDWAAAHPADGVSDLDAAIDRLPRGPT